MIIKTNQDEILGFLTDASNMPGGRAESVIFPENEQDVQEVIRDCSDRGIPVTVSGAGTGLTGGRVPFGGVVLSLSRMNRVLEIDAQAQRATVEPGVLLGEFQQDVEQHRLFYPPDPTERNCFIGATVATNSSGARTFKYGPTRDYVEALRVVLTNGESLVLRRGEFVAHGRHLEVKTSSGTRIGLELPHYTMPLTKHAAGYFVKPDMDVIDLFIGSEGTLGVITQITVRLISLPDQLLSGVVFFRDEPSMLAFVDEARTISRDQTTQSNVIPRLEARALEFIDKNALELIRHKFPTIPDDAFGGSVWFEQETTEDTEDVIMSLWWDLCIRHNVMIDESWFAVGLEDQRRMREFRHAVPSAVYEYISEHHQTKLGTDMAVPDGEMVGMLGFFREQFHNHSIRNVIYGHIGNNHLHANLFADGAEEIEQARAVYDRLIDRALNLGGTISAEHGVGKLKTRYLVKMYGEEGIEQMRNVKQVLDRSGILGVGTMFVSKE